MSTRKHSPSLTNLGLLVLLLIAGVVACPSNAFAQTEEATGLQNGTFCPTRIHLSSATKWAYLIKNAYCDPRGYACLMDPPSDDWTGAIQSCYLESGTAGEDRSCEQCPPNWKRCTPCDNYAAQCGEDTPDPDPDSAFLQKVWDSLDWLTA